MAGKIYVGIGGWTFEPWRGVFYPEGLTHKRELEYASRKLTSIEINGTYYSSFKPASWAKWRDETPDGFVFAMKASRFCTNRRELAEAGESVKRFVDQGLVELGDRLGPINWQFMGTKKFDPEDFEAFLKLLPREAGKLPLRHALEVRHASFKDPRFYDLARKYNAAIVYAHDEDFPEIDEPTADFTYARLMGAQEKVKTGYKPAELDNWAKRAKAWAKKGDAFVYFISGAKVRNPAAAQALIASSESCWGRATPVAAICSPGGRRKPMDRRLYSVDDADREGEVGDFLGLELGRHAAKASSGAWLSETSVTSSAHCRAAFSLAVKMSPASRQADTSIIFSTATPPFSRSRECSRCSRRSR